MPQDDNELTRNQVKALDALLSHKTLTAAAAAAGVSLRTVQRYLKDETFCDALRQEQDAIRRAHRARLIGGYGKALDTLDRVMDNLDATAAAQASAADKWMRHTERAIELDDLAERVARLEDGR